MKIVTQQGLSSNYANCRGRVFVCLTTSKNYLKINVVLVQNSRSGRGDLKSQFFLFTSRKLITNSFSYKTPELSLSSIECIIPLLMSGLVDDAKDAGDKMKAGAKAAGKKMEDPDRDASTEYNKEKVKEKVEDL
jgi:hypothetical protein